MSHYSIHKPLTLFRGFNWWGIIDDNFSYWDSILEFQIFKGGTQRVHKLDECKFGSAHGTGDRGNSAQDRTGECGAKSVQWGGVRAVGQRRTDYSHPSARAAHLSAAPYRLPCAGQGYRAGTSHIQPRYLASGYQLSRAERRFLPGHADLLSAQYTDTSSHVSRRRTQRLSAKYSQGTVSRNTISLFIIANRSLFVEINFVPFFAGP